ncbi:MAG TPA: hydantoinase/oxoprolinase family protein, partial [Thalassobaculum sp.]
PAATATAETGAAAAPKPIASRTVFDPARRDSIDYRVYARDDLRPGASIPGPALIVEDQTTTVVTSTFDVTVNPLGYLMLTARRGG